MKIVRHLVKIIEDSEYISLIADCAEIRVFFLTDQIIRWRVSFDRRFEEASYALTMTGWTDRLDGVLGDWRRQVTPVVPRISEDERYCTLSSNALSLRVDKASYHLAVLDGDGQVLFSELPGRAAKCDRQGRVYHYRRIDPERECYYGFGEQPGPLNKAGRVLRQAPRDSIGYDPELTTPLYKHIPFYITADKVTGRSYGLFYHNSYESLFDMGCERSGYWPRFACYCADGGDIDVFFIDGPTIGEVVERYTDLTGKTAFAPLDSLGYLGSTMYYVELDRDCDDAILDFVDKCQRENLPLSNFHLSSGYTADEKTGRRQVFTWNRRRFDSPRKFFKKMRERGVTVTANVKPGMLTDNPHYPAFAECGGFVLTADGQRPYVDRWWGGDGSFVDFTNPDARRLWKQLLRTQVLEMGTTSVWNDNCEYDSLDDRDARCHFDGAGGIIDQLKPVQSLLMAHAAHEAIAGLATNARPYIVNRSGFAGIQRYASTWAGDNRTSWSTLRANIATVLGMGLSGVANNGCDIGGFWGPAPDAELLVRWVQNGIFQPRFSIHSCNDDNTVTEPWMYSCHFDVIRAAIRLRYDLLPYLYSLLYDAHLTGRPIMRPLVYEFAGDRNVYEESLHFLVGPWLMAANVLEPGQTSKEVYLPAPDGWFYWPDRRYYRGGQTVSLPVDITSIPMFIRAGAIIPLTSGFTDINRERMTNLHLLIARGRDGEASTFTLFEDDGKTYAYRQGKYRTTTIRLTGGQTTVIEFARQGAYKSPVASFSAELLGGGKSPLSVTIDDRPVRHFLHRDAWQKAEEGWYYSHSRRAALIKGRQFSAVNRLTVNYDKFDLIGM
ncbi:MAG: DUF4968 domain-containing protein [Negativicutes bacterium]|nr:DUF4968 domain-containing protein [Negativicutes bacterium]